MRSSIVTIACLLGSLLWDDSVALILPIQRFGARAERDGVFSINRRLSFSLAAEQRGFAELMSADDTVQLETCVDSPTAFSTDSTVDVSTSCNPPKTLSLQGFKQYGVFEPQGSHRSATIMHARRSAGSDSDDRRSKASGAPLAEPPNPSPDAKPKPAKRKAATTAKATAKKLPAARDENSGSGETASARGSSSKSAATRKASTSSKSSTKSKASASSTRSSGSKSGSTSTSKRRKVDSPEVVARNAAAGTVDESESGNNYVNEAALAAEVDLEQVTVEPIGYTWSLNDKPLDDDSAAADPTAANPVKLNIMLKKDHEDIVRSLEGAKNIWIIAHIKSESPELVSESRALSLVAAEVLCVDEKLFTLTVSGAHLPKGTSVLGLQPQVPTSNGAPSDDTKDNHDVARLAAELAAAKEALDSAVKRADQAEEQVEQVTQQAEFEKAARAQAELQAMANRKNKLSAGSNDDNNDDDDSNENGALRAKMEAAMSVSDHTTTESEDDNDDEGIDTEASLLALEEELKIAAEEKALADEEAEKKKFEEDMLLLKQRQKVSISGATGFDGGNINGEYVPNGEMYNGKPLYYKNGDASKWLRFVSATKQWMVSTIEDTKAFNTKGMAESVDLNSEFPYQVKMWRLNQGLNSVTAASVKCIAILGNQPQMKSAVAPKTPKGLKDIKKANNKYISNAEKKECTLHVKNGELELTGAYVGEMRFGTAAGIGTVVWTDSDGSEVGWYNGGFVGGKMHGQGIFQWATGEKYEGEWHHDMMHGIGMMSRPDGSVEHVGRWSYDQPNYL